MEQSDQDKPTDLLSGLGLLTQAGINWCVVPLKSLDLSDSAAQTGNASTVINQLHKGQNQKATKKEENSININKVYHTGQNKHTNHTRRFSFLLSDVQGASVLDGSMSVAVLVISKT